MELATGCFTGSVLWTPSGRDLSLKPALPHSKLLCCDCAFLPILVVSYNQQQFILLPQLAQWFRCATWVHSSLQVFVTKALPSLFTAMDVMGTIYFTSMTEHKEKGQINLIAQAQ